MSVNLKKEYESLELGEHRWCNELSADIYRVDGGLLVRDFDVETGKVTHSCFVPMSAEDNKFWNRLEWGIIIVGYSVLSFFVYKFLILPSVIWSIK